jgi:uncharacterized membrane protein YozB (DUF420 family)
MNLTDLPGINALLNGSCFIFLVMGFIFIKKGNEKAHKFCMIAALLLSILFLSSYLYYHFNFGSKKFTGQGTVRTVYFVILISHTILAMVNLPMIILTFIHAFRENWSKHKKIAKYTFPVWAYVSLTGVIVYMFLYRWFPA